MIRPSTSSNDNSTEPWRTQSHDLLSYGNGNVHEPKGLSLSSGYRASALVGQSPRITTDENATRSLPFVCRFEDATSRKSKQMIPYVSNAPEWANAKR